MDDQRPRPQRPEPTGLPPAIGIDRPGSFSRSVFHERHPVLIANLLGDFPYPPRLRSNLEALLAETLDGTVPAEVPSGPSREAWAAELAEYAHSAWNDLPFLWAESYFYRRILAAVEYFTPGSPWHGVDPFAPQKHAQLDGPEIRADLDAYASLTEHDLQERRQSLLHASLWGNQADLGFRTNNPGAGQGDSAGDVIVDDSAALWDLVDAPGDRPVIVVADNAGREITADLALIDAILERGSDAASGDAGTGSVGTGKVGTGNVGTGTVELHLKADPYFVSDATGQDVLATLTALAADPNPPVQALAHRLRKAIREDRLRLRTNAFYTLPSTYRGLPPELERDFANAKLVILKGDLNYRRLVGDRAWDAATPFAEAVAYFLGPVAALRTAKSDLAVGIEPGRLADLDKASPDWRTSGTHAVIQVRP